MIFSSHSINGIPTIKAIHVAIKGSAKSVGKIRTTINTAKNANPNKSKIPDNVKTITSFKTFDML